MTLPAQSSRSPSRDRNRLGPSLRGGGGGGRGLARGDGGDVKRDRRSINANLHLPTSSSTQLARDPPLKHTLSEQKHLHVER